MIADDAERSLADTNVVVYAHDPSDPVRHDAARRLLQELSDAGRLTYSAHVFNKFCSRTMRPGTASKVVPVERLVSKGAVDRRA